MSDTYKCAWCGRHFEKGAGSKFLSGASMGFSDIGKKYCSKACETAAEEKKGPKSSSSSDNFSSGANAQPVIIKKGPTADEIRAEAEVERMERNENASQPWKFDDNFRKAESISKISFPDQPEDIEKTVLRIIKTAIDKIKSVIELSHAEFQQQTMGDQKSMWKPFYEEINLADTCIEKANEGIKKLRRFEGNTINAMMADCQDSLDDLKNKWYVKLIEKRDKKKKQTKIMVIVVVVLFAAMMIGLAIAA